FSKIVDSTNTLFIQEVYAPSVQIARISSDKSYNARLRGWQRITLNPNTTTATTAAHWDWKRHALTVPLEAFVMCVFLIPTLPFKGVAKGIYAKRHSIKNYHIHKAKMLHVDIFRL
ncbi:hypothetical protein, partial [Vibrio cholerae]|uniref:hypothetical protein n=1 Tax=Vibrio cholerae TaxID=666 RepID=UPI00196679DD